MKVEELKRYGEPFFDPPKETAGNAMKMIFKALTKRMGILGTVKFIFQCIAERKRVLKEYAADFKKVDEINEGMRHMVSIFVSVLRILSNRYGREESYEVMKGALQAIGRYNMPLIYDAADLKKCDGDTFDNFKKLNRSAFEACDKSGVVRIADSVETENMQSFILDRCDGCTIGAMFGWPEIGRMGCDHDLAGFPEIEDSLDFVFRRHKTLARGDEVCDFTFYRKGTEPPLTRKMK